jgi:predicted RNA-binding protein
MCLSKVFYIDSNGQWQEVMRDVARMEAHNDGFLLTGLLGEQKFARGKVRAVDFVDKHSVVLGANTPSHE